MEEAQRKREEVKIFFFRRRGVGLVRRQNGRSTEEERGGLKKKNVESKNVACTCHERRYHAFSVKLLIIE